MKLAAAEYWAHEFELAQPYAIAYQTYDRATNYFVSLTDTAGNRGYGCASPAEEVTGEGFVACAAALSEAGAATPVSDGKSLSRSLCSLLGNPHLRDRMGGLGRELVRANRGALERSTRIILEVLDGGDRAKAVRA